MTSGQLILMAQPFLPFRSPAISAAAAQGSGHVTEREVDEDPCD